MQIRFDHAVIHVSDWTSANDFYRRVLGAELIGEPDGPCRYRFGQNQLNVHGPGVDAHPLARVPVEPGNSDLCFAWEGPIEEAIEHLTRRRSRSRRGRSSDTAPAAPARASTSAIRTAACSSSSHMSLDNRS